MNDLFLKLSTEKTAATTKVSPRASDWGKEALNQFYSDFPELSNLPAQVKFKEKDEEKGYGIGAINLGQISLPIIIRENQMFPFDVALMQDKVVPFTKETIQLLLGSKSAFQEVSKEEQPDAFIRFFDSPYGIGPGYAMEKGSSWVILDEVSKNLVCESEFKEKLAEFIVSDPNFAVNLQKCNILRDGLSKIAEMETFDGNFDEDSLLKQAEQDIHYIYRNENGTFTKMSSNAHIDVWTEEKDLEEHEIKHLPAIQARESEKIANFEPRYSQTKGYVYKLASDDDLLIDNDGNYRILIGRDYDMTKKAGITNGNISGLAKFASLPKPGDTGFLFNPENSSIHTDVIEMRKIAFDPNGLHRLSGEYATLHGITKFATLRGIAVPKASDGVQYFPEKYVFAKLGEEIPESKLAMAYDERLLDLNAVRCIGEDHYEVIGPVLSKYAEKRDLVEANVHKVAFSVLQCGGSIEDVTKVAQLRPGQTYVVRSELSMPYTSDDIMYGAQKIASEQIGNDEYLFNIADVMKIASDLGNRRGVDAILGTAFLKKSTLSRFIDSLPLFEEASSMLAKLLIYVRMGTDGFNENAIKKAMEHLSTVIFELNGVKNLNKG